MKTKKVWVKPQKSKLSLPAHMPDAHRLAVLVGMIIRARLASGVGARLPDAAQAPYLAYDSGIFCRHDKTRQRRIRR